MQQQPRQPSVEPAQTRGGNRLAGTDKNKVNGLLSSQESLLLLTVLVLPLASNDVVDAASALAV